MLFGGGLALRGATLYELMKPLLFPKQCAVSGYMDFFLMISGMATQFPFFAIPTGSFPSLPISNQASSQVAFAGVRLEETCFCLAPAAADCCAVSAPGGLPERLGVRERPKAGKRRSSESRTFGQ